MKETIRAHTQVYLDNQVQLETLPCKNPIGVKTCDSLLIFSSEVLDLGLEQEVVDVEANIGNSEDEDLDSEQEDLARDELCGL
jgi:hypothetical protein